jgi:hypothetical protein
MFGELACAASPTSWTRPLDQVGGTSSIGENQTSDAGGISAGGGHRIGERPEQRREPGQVAARRIEGSFDRTSA